MPYPVILWLKIEASIIELTKFEVDPVDPETVLFLQPRPDLQ